MLPRIALDRVNVHLASRHVLKNVSWCLGEAEHWAFVGPNGSGKSTLLRVIAGTQWIDYDEGTRTYSSDGSSADVVARATTWIRYVSAEQHERYARLDLPLAGRSLIESGFADSVYVQRDLDGNESKRVEALIDGLDLRSFVSKPLREMSTGQLRRLLIARALVREPRVLVLDEFTTGLDRVAHRDILAVLDRLAANISLVVASHRADDFPLALTHTATVEDGRIVRAASGRPPQIRSTRNAARRTHTVHEHLPVLVRFEHADVYRGNTLVLRDVHWELRRGEHTAVRGANGAGKTTFAGLIAGTIPAATGAHIVRFGHTAPFDVWKLKERIAHVSDDLQIAYNRGETVEAVIASGFASSIGLFAEPSRAQRAVVVDLLARFGIEALGGRTFTRLSFGERRKILIARSLVRRPDILILDEAWNGLDTGFRQAVRVLLEELIGAGTTVVAIEHGEYDDALAFAIRTSTIDHGTVRTEPGAKPNG